MDPRTHLLSVSLAVFLLSLLSTTVTVYPAERPNVLLIYTDDQGSIDMGCYGSADLQTPHMDALARRGVRFTQMYAPSPICSPSRAGLLTGRHPLRAGLPTNVGARRGLVGMPQSEVTIADLLGEAGYRTGHVGKWHVGHTKETRPLAQGFDETYGHIGGCIDNYSHYFFWSGPNRHDLWRNGEEIWEDGKFFPDLMVRECNRFLEENRARPFFLYWAINVPHYPYQGTEKWRAAYQHLETPRREYAAFLSTMDDIIGQVLGKLDSLGLRERTLVIVQSDHGHSTEVRAFRGGGSAGPYRGAKGCLFEGGVRVPSIVSWPGHLPENETRDQMAMACDWLPTIAELCGVKLPARRLDGYSITSVIRSAKEPSPRRQIHWQFGDQWAVRDGDWKLLGNPRDNSAKAALTEADRLFLANLGRDVSEMTNYAKDHPDVVERLKRLHEEWAVEIEPAAQPDDALRARVVAALPTVDAVGKAAMGAVTYLEVDGRPAFLIRPQGEKPSTPMPWVWYAPTIGGQPRPAHTWMFRQLLAKRMAIAGIDVGESMGNPKGRATFSAFHKLLTETHGLAKRASLMPQSRGGLMLYNWAAEHPDHVACIAGIYTVCDINSWPGPKRAGVAYELSEKQFAAVLPQHNPIDRLAPLAKAGIPILHIHGDSDKPVPIDRNSGELARRYRKLGGKAKVIVIPGRGHEEAPEIFQCQEVVDFVIANARRGDKAR